ncbi:MAG: hypothetical protein CMH56_03820 [Myxococcales bacterium]|nr:hypothetical protein [Myxococcales bacterium]
MLESMGWARCNFRFLHRWLTEHHAKNQPEVAVFDFDNTCIYHDIGEAVLRWQLEHKAFRFGAETLKSILSPPPGAPAFLSDGTPVNELLDQMQVQFDLMKRGATDAKHNFLVLLFHLYNEGTNTKGLGPQYTYLMTAQMLAGYSAEEIDKLVHYVLDQERIHFGKTKTWTKKDPDLLGPNQTSYDMGLKHHPEIINLMKGLQKAKITPHIVTASAEHLVAPVTRFWDYPVKRENIIGVRLKIEKDCLTETPDEAHPQPIAEGKPKAIKKYLQQAPVFVAGDSFNDQPMLLGFEETQVRLLLHRPGAGLDFMYRSAIQDGQPARTFPVTVLQGRDKNTGSFNRNTTCS